jgi:hypothetical protein
MAYSMVQSWLLAAYLLGSCCQNDMSVQKNWLSTIACAPNTSAFGAVGSSFSFWNEEQLIIVTSRCFFSISVRRDIINNPAGFFDTAVHKGLGKIDQNGGCFYPRNNVICERTSYHSRWSLFMFAMGPKVPLLGMTNSCKSAVFCEVSVAVFFCGGPWPLWGRCGNCGHVNQT